jgi:uncharacterized protein (TIGR02284 family)
MDKLENQKLIVALNNLIETCKDAEKGFREASESIENAFYQVLLSEFSRQRGQFAKRLQARVRTLGGSPERKGSLAGTLHRGWMNLKAAVAKKDNRAVIIECKRGEEAGLKNFRAALNDKELPEDIRSMLKQQTAEIEETIKRLATMQK